MAAALERIASSRPATAMAWLPLLVMPICVLIFGAEWTPWVLMWALAFSIYAGLKWLTFADATQARQASALRSMGYLLLWPSMDAETFLYGRNNVHRVSTRDWLWSIGKIVLGTFLIFAVVPVVVVRSPLLAGWVGMAGVVFVLHFGLFHILSLLWQRAGVSAPPIMDVPVRASSLSDFWGGRWNLAFRDLAHAYVFRPLVRTCGVAGATMAVFLVSGLIHDLVISVPSGCGFGRPTLYFVIQGLGLLAERCRFGKRLRLGGGAAGRVFCAFVTLVPVGLLFHRPFVERVVLPMLEALRAI